MTLALLASWLIIITGTWAGAQVPNTVTQFRFETTAKTQQVCEELGRNTTAWLSQRGATNIRVSKCKRI